MSVEEELHEHAGHAKDPFDRQVALCMAIIAALLAVVSVFGHIMTTEELLMQAKASDQWSYYQAKSIRRYESEVAKDIFKDRTGQEALAEKYQKNVEKYTKEGEEIQEKAREFEHEGELAGRHALRLHFGEVFLEIAIVFSSLAILTKRRMFFWLAILGGASGALIGCSAYLQH